jgi:hypothetical protein
MIVLPEIRLRVACPEFATPHAWIYADHPAKRARKVRRIAHPAIQGDL